MMRPVETWVCAAVCFSYEDTHLYFPLCVCTYSPVFTCVDSALLFWFRWALSDTESNEKQSNSCANKAHHDGEMEMSVGLMCVLCVSHPGARLVENRRLGCAGHLSGVNFCINAELVELNQKKQKNSLQHAERSLPWINRGTEMCEKGHGHLQGEQRSVYIIFSMFSEGQG